MKKITFIIMSVFLAACSSTPVKEPAKAATANPPASTEGTPRPTANLKPVIIDAPAPPVEIKPENLTAEIQKLHSQSIYFDFDKSTVKPEFRGVIEQQAAFLKSHGNDTVTLEGNADERGSNEYNLALGNRRANAARKSLELMGVPSSQIKVISFGEEKPRLLCHNEKCWQENRRCDFAHKPN